MEGPKCHHFGRLGISISRKKGFTKLTPKAGRVSSTFLLPPELISGSSYARGLKCHLPFRGPIRSTNYNFHAHVQYCITIHYHSCSIEKKTEMWKVQITTILEGISQLRSTGPQFVLLLATRCHYQGVHLTEGQPDPKADHMSSLPDVVKTLGHQMSLLRVHLSSGQLFPSSYHCWPPDATMGCYIWVQVNWI